MAKLELNLKFNLIIEMKINGRKFKLIKIP